MLKSICVLVLAMSAFAGSLAADTQQQCSDVVPDVNLARDESPKEFEGGTITDGKLTLKPGYRIAEITDSKAIIESIAKKRRIAIYECVCTKKGICDVQVNVGKYLLGCRSRDCKGECSSQIKVVDAELK